MHDRPWLSSYSQGVPADINPAQYSSLVGLMEESFQKYARRVASPLVDGIIVLGTTSKRR